MYLFQKDKFYIFSFICIFDSTSGMKSMSSFVTPNGFVIWSKWVPGIWTCFAYLDFDFITLKNFSFWSRSTRFLFHRTLLSQSILNNGWIIKSFRLWILWEYRKIQFTVSTISAPVNIASAESDTVVLGNGNFIRGCVFGSHKLESTFLFSGSNIRIVIN